MSSVKVHTLHTAIATGKVTGTADYSKLKGFLQITTDGANYNTGSTHFGIRTYNHGDGSMILDHHNGGRLELKNDCTWIYTFKYNPDTFFLDSLILKNLLNQYMSEVVSLSGASSYSILSLNLGN